MATDSKSKRKKKSPPQEALQGANRHLGTLQEAPGSSRIDEDETGLSDERKSSSPLKYSRGQLQQKQSNEEDRWNSSKGKRKSSGKSQESYKSLHDISHLKASAFTSYLADATSVLSHIAHPGTERVDVIVHGACAMPSRTSDGNYPRALVAASTTMGFLHNEIQSHTHVSKQTGSCAAWDESCNVEFDGITTNNEALVLAIVDRDTGQVIVLYPIPVLFMQPYHHYHLELLMPFRHNMHCKLYISAVRKLPEIPHEHMGPVYGLEALLRYCDSPLSSNPGRLVVVARVVPDYSLYIPLSRKHNLFGINPRRIVFPQPKAASFLEKEKGANSNPQVSLPGPLSDHPEWNFPFIFASSRDKATMFTSGAALLLEYYQSFAQTKEEGWYLRNPIGFSLIPLDHNMFQALSKSNTSLGLSVSGVPILSNTLTNTKGKLATVTVALRLLSPCSVDTLATQSRTILDDLTKFDIHPFVHEMRFNCDAIGYTYRSPCLKTGEKPTTTQTLSKTDEEMERAKRTLHLVPKVDPNAKAEDVVEEYRVKVLAERLPHVPLNLQVGIQYICFHHS